MWLNNIKLTLRHLFRNKVYSAINIAGLSLGLACAMLIILYTKDELSYDRFHENADRIYRVAHKRLNPDGSLENSGGNSGYLQGPKFHASIPEIEAFVRFQGQQRELKQGTEIVSKQVHFVDPNFFSVFSFPLLYGNPTTALQQPNSLVISEKTALENFGTTDALGKTILFKENDQFELYAITGVAENCPQNSSIRFDFLLPIKVVRDEEKWGNFFLNTFVMLAPDADAKATEAKMKKVYESDASEEIREMAEKFDFKSTIVHVLQPFTGMHLSKSYRADNGLSSPSDPMYSYILSAIAIFILLIACINFVNLTVARSVRRAKEIGIRKVVGSSKKQLMVQFLGESIVLCLTAFVFAIVIVQSVLPAFNQLANKALFISYLLDQKLVLGYIALFGITSLLAGFYPALVLSGFNPVQTLYNRMILTGKNQLQKGLVVLQFTLATMLVVATLTIYLQFNYLTTKELGYDDSNIVIIQKWGMNHREARVLKSELSKDANILEVAFKNGGRSGTLAKVNGETQIGFDYETVDDAYLPLYKIPVVNGRNFSPNFPSDSGNAVLVNETFVKEAGWKEPIGQEVNFWYREDDIKYTVVGVVKDHHFLSLAQPIGPQLFTMRPHNDYGLALIRIKPKTETASLRFIENTYKKLFPNSLYSYSFKDQENLRHYEAEAKWKQMMLSGAVFTIFISCIGLFGLSVLAAEKRTKEIGIRKVLGASVGVITSALSKDFLKLVSIALLIAMPIAWYFANSWIQRYPYHIDLSIWVFAAAGLLVIVVSMTTVSFQAIRAARANPVDSLRNE